MESTSAPVGESEGFIVTNPPYGHRLGNAAEAEAVYQRMASLRTRFPGWKLAVITDHAGFESHFGREANIIRQVTNGALQTYLYVFYNASTIGAPRNKPGSDEDDAGGVAEGESEND
jgi:putative N6-adenine-specific DNA methylase